jgi:hypothetical protein
MSRERGVDASTSAVDSSQLAFAWTLSMAKLMARFTISAIFLGNRSPVFEIISSGITRVVHSFGGIPSVGA